LTGRRGWVALTTPNIFNVKALRMTAFPSDMKPKTAPGVATAEQGIVMLDGPDGVAVSLTPEAAEQTGRSLIDAAAEAMRQLDTEAGGAR